MRSRRWFAVPALVMGLALGLIAGAGSQAVELTGEQAAFDSATLNAFARENLPSFSTATLSNGIPVIIKRSTTNRILTLKAVLTGHVAYIPSDKAGLEAVMLTMLTRGSQHYPYEEVQRLSYDTTSSIVARYQSYDISSIDLVTIDTYFPKLFPMFADAILHPAWNAEEFPRVISDFKLNRQQAESEPFSDAVLRLDQRFLSGHPYASSWLGVDDSLDHLTLEDLRSYYARAMTARRLFLVAVGDFDPATLLPKLESTFGTLPRAASGPQAARPAIPSLQGKVTPDLLVVPFPRSAGLAYVRGQFAMPGPDSPDYAPSLLAFDLLNDILFEILRTRNGACYSVDSSMDGGSAAWGDITVYRTAVPTKVKAMVDQSIAVLTSGRCMSGNVNVSAAGKGGLGSAEKAKSSAFVPVADALPFYKLKFITEFYAGQQTNRQIAAQIAGSLFYHGDYRHYLLLIDRINAITADDVVRVARAYLLNNPTIWIALGDPALLEGMNKEEFRTP